MDPVATWETIERSQDRGEVGMAADAMVGWLEKDGFIPSGLARILHADRCESREANFEAKVICRLIRRVAELL